jgi:hypothetical protein
MKLKCAEDEGGENGCTFGVIAKKMSKFVKGLLILLYL